ncbi:MAG TPA: EAL domain-containing protein [Desulfuromonadaceae bacterium]
MFNELFLSSFIHGSNIIAWSDPRLINRKELSIAEFTNNLIRVILDFLTQFAGGRGGIDNNVVQFGVAATIWSVLLAFAMERRKEDDPPRERLLAWGFLFGLGREILMLAMAFILAMRLVDYNLLHVAFPPLEHALSNAAVFFIAGAFLLFLFERSCLSRRYLVCSLGSVVGCYLTTFWWWAHFILDNPDSRFGQTWCDWLFHINACIWLLVPIVLVLRRQKGWLRNLVVTALGFFFMAEFLKLPDMAMGEVHEHIFTPIRHSCYLLGIFVLGFVYVREQSAERKRAKMEILHLAFHDTLTGLPNRILFTDRLQLALEQVKRSNGKMALMFLDLDCFKRINDTRGHAGGDLLLQAVSHRLGTIVRQGDTVARMGGDEFVLLLPWLQDPEDGIRVAEKILEAVKLPFDLAGQSISTSTSIGIAFYPGDGSSAEELLKHADMAMYAAKGEGRGCYHLFSDEIRSRIMKRHRFEDSLRQALQQEQFFLVYQPQADVRTGKMIGVEALVRWNHPEQGIIYPDDFIDLAEETGLILQLGEWVLRTACLQLRTWQNLGAPLMHISVNVSTVQFNHPDFLRTVDCILIETGIDSSFVELEMTETVLMNSSTVEILAQLKRRGFRLAIDDFGTGYSSLSYLKHFPVDRIKIDKSFVQGITSNKSDSVIVRTIIAMAHSLDLLALAEGVESGDQLQLLRELDCNQVQGYYIGRPITSEELLVRIVGTSSFASCDRLSGPNQANISH